MWDTILNAVKDFWSDNADAIVSTLFVLVIAFIVSRVAKKGIDAWEAKVQDELGSSDDDADRERGQRLVTIGDVLKVAISVVVVAVVVLTIMGVWGLPLTPLIAIGSTIGIAVGLGAQDVVRDVIAGFLILVEDQYSIGDTVTIVDVSGTVESIKLRTTVLRDLDGNRHFVPNGQIKVASNLTSEFSRLVLDIPVSVEADVDRAMKVILSEANSLATAPEWRDRFLEAPEMLGVNRLGDATVDLRLLMTLTSDSRWAVKREFLRRLKIRFDHEGIAVPYQNAVILEAGNRLRGATAEPDSGSAQADPAE